MIPPIETPATGRACPLHKLAVMKALLLENIHDEAIPQPSTLTRQLAAPTHILTPRGEVKETSIQIGRSKSLGTKLEKKLESK